MSTVKEEESKLKKRFRLVGWVVGGAGIAVIIGAIPFLSPALRRICLPYVPATPTQLSRVISIVGGAPKHVIDVGSGDGRIVRCIIINI